MLFRSGAGARAVVFVDDGVMRANPGLEPAVRAAFAGVPGMPELAELAAVTGGERAKQDLAVVDRAVESVERHRIDRQSYVVAIGGGAVRE